MDNFTIETAQNVTIRQNVASVSTRIKAYIIDLFIMGGYLILVFLLLNALDYQLKSSELVMYFLLGSPLFFYFLLFELLMEGQSPGKYLSKIRVTKLDGSKPTFGNYLIRWSLRLVDITIASGSVAMLTLLLNGKGQRLGDIAAGTTVISEEKKLTINDTVLVDLPENYTPTFPQVTLLSDKDMEAIKTLFSKAKQKGNHKIIIQLHNKVIELTGITTTLPPIEFLSVVVKDYNYFTQKM